MNNTILVPLDGSRLAERALPYAMQLARMTAGQVLLLHVAPDVALTRQAEDMLASRARQLRQENVRVSSTIRCGDPAQQIADVASAQDAGLIAMSTHGESGLGRWLYGSVPDGVLRRTPLPILLVPATCEHPWPASGPRRILVPCDGSRSALEAVEPAATLARLFGAEVRLLRVLEPPFHPDVATAHDDDSRQLIEDTVQRLRARAINVSLCSDVGPPAQRIAAHAQDEGTDLVVLATHGHTGLAERVMGSVAAGVVGRANRPLLLVRPEAIRAAAPAPREVTPGAITPSGRTVDVALTLEEIDLVQRGLQRLLGEVHPAEPVAGLCARLRMAAARSREPKTTGNQAAAIVVG